MKSTFHDFKCRVLGASYGHEGLTFFDTGGYLGARTRTARPIFVVPGTFTQAHYQAATHEALSAGLSMEKIYVIATRSACTEPSVHLMKFVQLPGFAEMQEELELYERSDPLGRIACSTRIVDLQTKLAASEAKFEPLRVSRDTGGQRWNEVEVEAAGFRQQLFELSGDYYGRPPKTKLSRPSDEVLTAVYEHPDDVPQDVMTWVLKNASRCY